MTQPRLLVPLVLFGLAACQAEDAGTSEIYERLPSVTGTVTFTLPQGGLPSGSVLEVQLQDVSIADAPARVVAENVIFKPESSPVEFDLQFDPDNIQPSHAYAVRATIRQDARLMFVTDTMIPVLTRGAPARADIQLMQVAASVPTAEQAVDRLASGIRERLSRLETTRGDRTMGDTSLRFTVWSDEVDVVYIWEARQHGDKGQSTVHMYFNNGSLVLYQEEGVDNPRGPQGESRSIHRDLRLYFDEPGHFLSGSKQLDGREVQTEDSEIDGAWSHAQSMLDWVAWNSAGSMPGDGIECEAPEAGFSILLGPDSATLTPADPAVGPLKFRGSASLMEGGRIQWQGSGHAGDFSASIAPGRCYEGQSGSDPWSHTLRAALPGVPEIQACCRIRETRLLSEQVLDLQALPEADLAAARSAGHWTGQLPDLDALLRICLARTGGPDPRVLHAGFPNPGVGVLLLSDGKSGIFQCAGLINGHAGIDFRLLPGGIPAVIGRSEVIFSPVTSGVPAGACFEHEKVLDNNGRLMGYLSHDTC
jgi:putative lipoprotein